MKVDIHAADADIDADIDTEKRKRGKWRAIDIFQHNQIQEEWTKG